MADASVAPLKSRLQQEMKAAMKAGEKKRRDIIRLIMAALKQREVDERITLNDGDIVAILDKMVKQRRESIVQYRAGKREDLVAVEEAEIVVIQEFLPAALSDDEIAQMVEQALSDSGAATVRDMGKVMAVLKPQMQGRADMGPVSQLVKSRLS